ncbi:MAG: DUF2004 domain-containing protein [Porticoccus sp.]|nr:DUF2004 domain-containing protein [Porticoccus sp.]
MNIIPFGEIDPNNLEEYYDGAIEINGIPVDVDINFESETTDVDTLNKVSKFIGTIDAQIKKAFESLSSDYDLGEESETALFYLQHHKEELSNDELIKIFGTTEITKNIFFKNIAVNRVGLYPEDEESYSVIDIKLPDEYTNYIMAVTFDEDGELSYISMDS